MENQGQNQEQKDYGQVHFSWQFHEFAQHERSKSWYFWAGAAVVFLVGYSIISSNFLFGLIIIIAALTIVMLQRNNQEIEFKIAEDGIVVGKKFYEYKRLKNFYIIFNPPEVKTLYFEPKSFFEPRIPVALNDQDPVKIREVLLQYLEEDIDREDEPVSDQTSRMLKL
ncbi:MAG: hypothetical protein HUU49_02870 [Candidatus Buchananbacteria bacterium]|nr:hypothetical protein [Candidatus Buchananbacteria bacterium]